MFGHDQRVEVEREPAAVPAPATDRWEARVAAAPDPFDDAAWEEEGTRYGQPRAPGRQPLD
jgi:hypothetical protein